MKEKTNSLMHRLWEKSWNEPRHFFFWLSLLSPFLFVFVLFISGLAGEPPPLIHWVALAAVVGFFLGVPAFILSWVPPLRPLFQWLLRRRLFVLACLVSLIALFYAVENWRGRSAWNQFRHEWESRGVGFELEQIVPPPIPPEENMYEAEPWRGYKFQKVNGEIVYANSNIRSEVWFDTTGPDSKQSPRVTDIFTARPLDLTAWQKYYRGTNNVFATPEGSTTNYFPVAPQVQTPPQDVLLALSKFDARLTQIRAAADRPHARFWINFEDGMGALFPHLAKIKGIAQFLSLRANAELANGQSDAALEDVQLGFRLNQAVRDEPTLIAQLVGIAAMHINLGVLWEGLADHRWSEPQLAAIESELAQVDLLTAYQTGMSMERYFSIWCVDLVERTRDMAALTEVAPPPDEVGLGSRMLAAGGKILFRLVPTGWFNQNKLSLNRLHVEYIRPLVDPEKQLVRPANYHRASEPINSWQPNPYDLFTGMLLPALEKVAKKSAIAQTYVNLAHIACALERYRLANGSYPDSLNQLTTQFISTLPHDVINGDPLKYRRNADGSFILYSVGWNETDDGGEVALRKDNQRLADLDQGDWVWRYPED